jgi:hypothetical protein
MRSGKIILRWLTIALLTLPSALMAQNSSDVSSSSVSSQQTKTKPPALQRSGIEPGVVTNGVYRNKSLQLACKIPDGWVLRTDEMNASEAEDKNVAPGAKEQPHSAKDSAPDGRVLLAAFSRPPEARGEDVNASIVIAAESAASYPGLKEAVQYFEPLTEVARAQGFLLDEDPYEIALGSKTLVRGDFHKNVGTRVMRQSTLVMLARGYAVSITVIGGTDDEVEDLVDSLDFAVGKPSPK